MADFVAILVVGVPAGLPSGQTASTSALLAPGSDLAIAAALLVTVPVFIQAPWVRASPWTAALFTLPMLGLALLLERHGKGRWASLGALLMGFCGSWLGGGLFWGWCRLHPIWHLPLEAFAMPLALGGLLHSRWRLAGAFYLASLVGTAATDAVLATSGLMPLWPDVLQASAQEAPALLQSAALAVLEPAPLAITVSMACAVGLLSRWLWELGGIWRVSAATLATTLAVDGVFLAFALVLPRLSGLI